VLVTNVVEEPVDLIQKLPVIERGEQAVDVEGTPKVFKQAML